MIMVGSSRGEWELVGRIARCAKVWTVVFDVLVVALLSARGAMISHRGCRKRGFLRALAGDLTERTKREK